MIEALVYLAVGVAIVGALVWQARRRSAFSKLPVLVAPVAQRRLIVTALLFSLGLLAAMFAAMGVSLEAWPFAGGAGLIAAVLFGSLWFTRTPLATLELDSTQQVLTSVVGTVTTRVVLSQPFRFHSAVKLPMLTRGHPWMLVTVEQNAQSISFCFPWGMSELGATPKQTSEPLPFLMLDWRGAVILQRLRAVAPAEPSGPSSAAGS